MSKKTGLCNVYLISELIIPEVSNDHYSGKKVELFNDYVIISEVSKNEVYLKELQDKEKDLNDKNINLKIKVEKSKEYSKCLEEKIRLNDDMKY